MSAAVLLISAAAPPPWLSASGLEGGREVEAELQQQFCVPGQVRREPLLTSGLGQVDLGGGGCCRDELVLLTHWGFRPLVDKNMSLRDYQASFPSASGMDGRRA